VSNEVRYGKHVVTKEGDKILSVGYTGGGKARWVLRRRRFLKALPGFLGRVVTIIVAGLVIQVLAHVIFDDERRTYGASVVHHDRSGYTLTFLSPRGELKHFAASPYTKIELDPWLAFEKLPVQVEVRKCGWIVGPREHVVIRVASWDLIHPADRHRRRFSVNDGHNLGT
jgi:hypothetical protein